jgi:hypothetical protein
MHPIDARPGIAHCHEDAVAILLGADQQLPCPRVNRAHCFNRVQDQVQDHLLQLNAIPLKGKQSVCKPGLDRDAIPDEYASRQYDHLIDCRIKIKTLLPGRRFLDLLTNAVDDVSGSIDIANDTAERFPDLAQVGGLHVQKILGSTGMLRALAIGCVIS